MVQRESEAYSAACLSSVAFAATAHVALQPVVWGRCAKANNRGALWKLGLTDYCLGEVFAFSIYFSFYSRIGVMRIRITNNVVRELAITDQRSTDVRSTHLAYR